MLLAANGSELADLDTSIVIFSCRTACFHLEEYETALQCFQQGQQLAPDMTKFRTWIKRCQAELDGECF